MGLVNKTNFDHVYYINSLPALGKANSGTSTECLALPGKSMTDGTLLSYLNAFKNSYSGPLTLRSWVSGPNGYPVFDGIAANPSTGKNDGFAPVLAFDPSGANIENLVYKPEHTQPKPSRSEQFDREMENLAGIYGVDKAEAES